jgi:beta-phosphoglucomutase-like phosphatase (HAD superfamily)
VVGFDPQGDGMTTQVERRGTDWMWELAVHYERMRRAYPDDELCIVFDIDGTILDVRYLVAHALVAYDRAHDTEYFQGLRAEDVTVHEDRIDELLADLALPAAVRADVLAWYAEHLWSPEAILAANRPYQGALGVIRWFQLQPATCVALNTGRPEQIRDLTLQSLNALGKAYRVAFRSDLLCMNPYGRGRRVADSKVACLRQFQARGLRVVAVVDNEPAIIQAMAAADQTHEILFLHADTIFESQRVVTPRTVQGTTYDLAELVSEEELRHRVQFVWHGVNDEANLRQFLASDVQWAECDVRRDPLDRLVLRHDAFEETPWHRAEHPFRLETCLRALHEQQRSVKLDLKEAGAVVDRVLGIVATIGFDDGSLWFNGTIEALCEPGIRHLAEAHPGATISVPVDFLGPLLLAAPTLAGEVLDTLRSWGVNRWSLDWQTPRIRELIDRLEEWGCDVNIYGVPDLEAFLEASLLLPKSVTADFNFPDWHYFGRGAGQHRAYYRYQLADRTPSDR